MKVTAAGTLICDAGWRSHYFVIEPAWVQLKGPHSPMRQRRLRGFGVLQDHPSQLNQLSTDAGITGWSEYDEGFGSPGVTAVVEQLKQRLIGRPVNGHERSFQLASCLTCPVPGSVVAQSIGALENVPPDAKALGVPCYELLGGKLRGTVRVYRSHCPTWRIDRPASYPPAVTGLKGVTRTAAEACKPGFAALKTNLFIHEDGPAHAWRAGFAIPFQPELTVDNKLIRNIHRHLEARREGAGQAMGILIGINFDAKPRGLLKLLRAIPDPDLFWVEIDLHNQAVNVAIVDAVRNGVGQAMKIAALAYAHDVSIAPHDFYGDLCTMTNAHFAAAVPNLYIMEVDIDRLPWEGELFTHAPDYRGGHLRVPDHPGWGTEPIEEAIRARPPRVTGGLPQYERAWSAVSLASTA